MQNLEELIEEQIANIYRTKHPDLVKDIIALLQLGESPDTIVKNIELRTGASHTTNNLWMVANYFFKQYYKPYESSI